MKRSLHSNHHLVEVLVCIFMLASAGGLHAQVVLEKIADNETVEPSTGGTFMYFGYEGSVESGTVIFPASVCIDWDPDLYECGEYYDGLFRHGHAGFEVLVDNRTAAPPTELLFGSFFLPVQDDESVAFVGDAGACCPQPELSGIYRSSSGLLELVAAKPNIDDVFHPYESPAYQDGVLAFEEVVQGDPYIHRVLAERGEGIETIADENTLIPGTSVTFDRVGSPVTSEGKILFVGARGWPYEDGTILGLYQEDEGVISRVVDVSTQVPGSTETFADFMSHGFDRGQFAFIGYGSDSAQGIYADLGAGLVTIADQDTDVPEGFGTFSYFGWRACFGGGTVAFTGTDDLDFDGLYVYRNGTLTKVIREGDELDGRIVRYINIGGNECADANDIVFHVELSDDARAMYVAHFLDSAPSLQLLSDLDGDQLPEVAAVMADSASGEQEVHIRNPLTGAVVSRIGFGTDPVLGITTVPHFGAGPSGEMSALGVRSDGTPRTQTRDCESGDFIRNQIYFNGEWQPVDMVELPDLQGSGFPEIGVLARNRTDGEIAVQIRDGATGQFIKNLFFFNPNWTPMMAVVVPDLMAPGTGVPEVGVLATHDTTGQIAVMMKDAATNAFAGNVFYLNANWQPLDLVVVEDMPSVAHPTLALLATHKTTGQIVTMLKDAATNGFLLNLFHLGSNWQPTQLVALSDTTGPASPDVTVLGVHKDFGQIVAQTRDAATNAFVKNVRPLGSAWLPMDMVAAGDLNGAGGDELVVMATRKSDGKTVLQTIDASSGAVISNAFLN